MPMKNRGDLIPDPSCGSSKSIWNYIGQEVYIFSTDLNSVLLVDVFCKAYITHQKLDFDTNLWLIELFYVPFLIFSRKCLPAQLVSEPLKQRDTKL